MFNIIININMYIYIVVFVCIIATTYNIISISSHMYFFVFNSSRRRPTFEHVSCSSSEKPISAQPYVKAHFSGSTHLRLAPPRSARSLLERPPPPFFHFDALRTLSRAELPNLACAIPQNALISTLRENPAPAQRALRNPPAPSPPAAVAICSSSSHRRAHRSGTPAWSWEGRRRGMGTTGSSQKGSLSSSPTLSGNSGSGDSSSA